MTQSTSEMERSYQIPLATRPAVIAGWLLIIFLLGTNVNAQEQVNFTNLASTYPLPVSYNWLLPNPYQSPWSYTNLSTVPSPLTQASWLNNLTSQTLNPLNVEDYYKYLSSIVLHPLVPVLQGPSPEYHGLAVEWGDILWRHPDGRCAVWQMDGTNFLASAAISVASGGWTPIGLADLDQDNELDILLKDKKGRICLGHTYFGAIWAGTLLRNGQAVGKGWYFAGLTDFNNDNFVDILWRHNDGRLSAWLMNGTNYIMSYPFKGGRRADPAWRVAATVDLNGDGRGDIIWQHTSGKLAFSSMGESDLNPSIALNKGRAVAKGMRLMAASDFDGNGTPDLVWQDAKRRVVLWMMKGTNHISSVNLHEGKPAAPDWKIVGMQ